MAYFHWESQWYVLVSHLVCYEFHEICLVLFFFLTRSSCTGSTSLVSFLVSSEESSCPQGFVESVDARCILAWDVALGDTELSIVLESIFFFAGALSVVVQVA